MSDETSTRTVNARMSLLREMVLGTFWCVAGIFLTGPLASVAYQLLDRHTQTESMTEMLAAGFLMVVSLVLWAAGLVILAPVGAIVGAVSYRLFRHAERYSRWRTVAGALIADAVIAFGLAGLLFFIRS